MVDLGEVLYWVSWGFAILWLGFSIIVGYLAGANILGIYLLGIGVYGVVLGLYAFDRSSDKVYLIFVSAALVSLLVGSSILLGGVIDPIILVGVILVIIGIMLIIYYVV